MSRRFFKRQRRIAGMKDPVMEDGQSTDIVIPIMGPTGAGKSSFINSLLGEECMTVGHSLMSCTTHLATAIIDPIPGHPHLKGHRLVIVDTPGFDDTFKEDAEILRRIAKWLETSYRSQMVLGGVIYLHDISHDRFSGTARRNLEIFRHLCGDAALNKVVLGTTKWKRIPPNDGMRREEELKAIHWKDMVDKGTAVCRFGGSKKSAWDLINNIIRRIEEHTVLEIQKELVDYQKLVPETKAGKELRHTLQQVLDMQQQMVDFEAGLAEGGDPEAQAKLEETQEKLRETLRQIQTLKIPLSRRIKTWFGLV